MMYEQYEAEGQNLTATIKALKRALASKSEAEALQLLQELIKEACNQTGHSGEVVAATDE